MKYMNSLIKYHFVCRQLLPDLLQRGSAGTKRNRETRGEGHRESFHRRRHRGGGCSGKHSSRSAALGEADQPTLTYYYCRKQSKYKIVQQYFCKITGSCMNIISLCHEFSRDLLIKGFPYKLWLGKIAWFWFLTRTFLGCKRCPGLCQLWVKTQRVKLRKPSTLQMSSDGFSGREMMIRLLDDIGDIFSQTMFCHKSLIHQLLFLMSKGTACFRR